MHLAALSVIVPDYEAGIAFFCGTLGFELCEDIPQGNKRWVTVAAPGSQTRIVLARAATQAQRAAIGQQGAGRVWLFLETDNFARDHAALIARGIVFEEAPRDEIYGTVAVFRDPFGNRWDLIQRAS
ncbi:VOC family protein [Roseobacter sinensis]|uniref:VOC family protein n=1 Tax=Roseobacter sinensis TaxID=2931391 RepID=A0ABT3BGK5_9RHOB|nr:VOC family protein [Roseobacter sp. WL0113]MCV3272672.1 VOC family protein [Roseobacter sp. WL0113]